MSRPVVVAGFVAVVVYLGMRFGLAQGAGSQYCEEMGLFENVRYICYAELDGSGRLLQHFYNVSATAVGTLVPPLFDFFGAFNSLSKLMSVAGIERLAFSALLVALAAVGVPARPRQALPILALVAANAALSFMLYRPRNQLVGMVGVYAAAGLGLTAI